MTARTLRTVLVDDVPLARQKLARLLAAHPDVDIVGEAADGPAAVAALQSLEPDLVFLDVQMPELDGFGVVVEAMAAGQSKRPAIVFVTAYDHYAASAFAIEAVDYLLKPPTPERLAQCLRRVRDAAPYRTRQHPSRIRVRERDGCRWVAVSGIAWIETAGNYLVVHADDGRHVIRATLSTLEATLDPRLFCRISRSRLIALDRIRALEPRHSGDQVAVLDDNVRLPVSRGCRVELVDRLQGRHAGGTR